MTIQHACPRCRQALPRGVTNCPNCGISLRGLREAVSTLSEAVEGEVRRTAAKPRAAVAATSDGAPVEVVAGRYQVAHQFPLQTCTFYQVVDRETDSVYLLRRTRRPRAMAQPLMQRLRQVGRREIDRVLVHQEIVSDDESSYAVVRYPGSGWRSLSLAPAPMPLERALLWVHQAGSALLELTRQGLGHYPPGLAGREGFVLDAQGQLFLADLTLCYPLQEGETAQSRPLASLLAYLSTGEELPTQEETLEGWPERIGALLQRERDGASLEAFMAALSEELATARPRRALRQMAGNATDTGSRRAHNEDWVAALSYALDRTGDSIPLGIYIVADGMGGHSAGEHASSSSIRQALLYFVSQRIVPDLHNVTRRLSPETTPEEQLQAMVRAANERVYENRVESGGDRGSTMTAAMILGEDCVVANVGDSRTYLYRDRHLQQITEDHSLVARLVKAGEIEADEIYTHAKRNQIYRSLGDQPEIPVDTFTLQLKAGDRLLLCSDGLWEMVRDPQIAQLLAEEANPQRACDRLIAAANENGGEDNISAIVVDVQ